jgi:hypothetical protein
MWPTLQSNHDAIANNMANIVASKNFVIAKNATSNDDGIANNNSGNMFAPDIDFLKLNERI